MENLEKFVNDLLDEKLEAHVKSEPVPDNSDKDVKVTLTYFLYVSKYTVELQWLKHL